MKGISITLAMAVSIFMFAAETRITAPLSRDVAKDGNGKSKERWCRLPSPFPARGETRNRYLLTPRKNALKTTMQADQL
jgi:hypothetical protein